jgi:YfiR/HmsC-like
MIAAAASYSRCILASAWRVLAVGSMLLCRAVAQDAAEYDVKAACLSKLAEFVKWPPSAFESATAPITIGVLGADPFGKVLPDLLRGKTVGGRSISLKRSRVPADLQTCQMVFISQSESARLGDILAGFQGRPIVTVGDVSGFCTGGGVINMVVTKRGSVGFEVNVGAAKRQGLHIKPNFLKLAPKLY